MAPKPTKAGNVRNGVFVLLDPLLMDRLRRQASRNQGDLEGAKQSYVRAALIERLQKDELKENEITDKLSRTAVERTSEEIQTS